jgi:hypothetical protein
MNTCEVTVTKVSLTQEELTTLSNARDIIGDIIDLAGWKNLQVEDLFAEDELSTIANDHLKKAYSVLDDLCGYQKFAI